jgi:hypothetical protein
MEIFFPLNPSHLRCTFASKGR